MKDFVGDVNEKYWVKINNSNEVKIEERESSFKNKNSRRGTVYLMTANDPVDIRHRP